MSKILLSIMTAASLVGCSNPHKAKDVETEMERSETVSGEQVGIKDGDLVVQKKLQLAEHVRRLQNEVYETEDRVYGNRTYGSWGLYGTLKDCKIKLASKEYGGDGKLSWMEKIDRVTEREEKFELGKDEKDNLVAVKEEYLNDRISRFQKHRDILRGREEEYLEKVDVCQAELRSRQHDKKQATTVKTEEPATKTEE